LRDVGGRKKKKSHDPGGTGGKGWDVTTRTVGDQKTRGVGGVNKGGVSGKAGLHPTKEQKQKRIIWGGGTGKRGTKKEGVRTSRWGGK